MFVLRAGRGGAAVFVRAGMRVLKKRATPSPLDSAVTRRVLSELRKLDRYERRAAVQRDRAVRGLYDRRNHGNNL